MGIKTANYPLVVEDLESARLPPAIVRNKHKTMGLSTSAKNLHNMREERYKGSKYAELATCNNELQQANQIFLRYNIPVITSDGRSIEETATQVIQKLSLTRLPHL
jgi:regulator of PEP synthase PpsR (kinase-PPPase family)